ncbi:hypothetical protein BD779DRAFT_1388447, partial [Infundibulicybe gibba]
MPRIVHDPTQDICPDYLSDAYLAVRTAFAAAQGFTPEAVAATLTTAWEAAHLTQVTAWEAQYLADHEAENERQAEEDENTRRIALQEAREEAAEKRTREKKKPKLAPFADDVAVPDEVQLRPSQFALHKLELYEYVELWYFTQEGCLEARKSQRAAANEAYGITTLGPDELMALKPVASFKGSTKAIPDQDLTWRQMSTAKNCLLASMAKVGWPERYLLSLALFFHHLDCSPWRVRMNGDQILLRYQARVRQDWHEALRSADGDAFNISLLNDMVIRSIADEIWDDHRRASTTTVSN